MKTVLTWIGPYISSSLAPLAKEVNTERLNDLTKVTLVCDKALNRIDVPWGKQVLWWLPHGQPWVECWTWQLENDAHLHACSKS